MSCPEIEHCSYYPIVY